MSWGERSGKPPCRALNEDCDEKNCNVDCYGYEWDGVTKPDSTKKPVKKLITNPAASAAVSAFSGMNREQRRKRMRGK
jgi:hypothetical protein